MDNRDQNKDDQNIIGQSRALWIILSVLTVFAIAIVIGIFFFFPIDKEKSDTPQLSSADSPQRPLDFDPIESVNDEKLPGMVDPGKSYDSFSIDDNDSSYNENASNSEMSPSNSDKDVEETLSSTENQEVYRQDQVSERSTPKERVKPDPIESQVVLKRDQTMKISVTVYWIQVGSYNDEIKAKEVRDYLYSKDISSEIQTMSVNGKTFYRVRIGAYQSNGEATRFVKEIQTLNGFEESYVVQTTMIKEVPVN